MLQVRAVATAALGSLATALPDLEAYAQVRGALPCDLVGLLALHVRVCAKGVSRRTLGLKSLGFLCMWAVSQQPTLVTALCTYSQDVAFLSLRPNK